MGTSCFGILGAAIATAINEAILSLVCVIWVYREYGYDISALGMRRLHTGKVIQ